MSSNRRKLRPIHLRILGLTMVFVILAIAGAVVGVGVERFLPKKVERGPSSVIYNDDDELVMEDVGLDELREKPRGATHPHHRDAVFAAAPGKKLIFNPIEISHLTGTTQGLRARPVIFEPAAFNRFVTSGERRVPMDLFDDVHLNVHFGETPSYGPNVGVFSGSVDSDPEARVHLFVSGSHIGGTIETSGRLYRILDGGGGQGLHYIVEERSSKH